jgi:hypothetical protein
LNTNWLAIYGATDGSCGVTSTGSGSSLVLSANCANGNINSISDVRRGFNFTARTIDCTASALSVQTARVCYFPSSARLGIDNDNLTIVSSVYNDNIPIELRGFAPASPAWEGTRMRVWKKAAVYTGLSSVAGGCSSLPGVYCPGASQAASATNPPTPATTPPTQLQGDYYDLFNPGNNPASAGAESFTFDIVINQPLPGSTQTRPARGLNYEPDHVRGRSLATFNGNGNTNGGFSSIWGTVYQGVCVHLNLAVTPPTTTAACNAVTTDFGGTNPPQTLCITVRSPTPR